MSTRSGSRSRWVAMGATLAVVLGAGGVLTSAAGSTGASSFVPITPCRLIDTRPAPETVGPRGAPLGPLTTFTASVWGQNGNCTVPAGATGVSLNVVVVFPTAASFLTVFPTDQNRPLAASMNWVAGQAPTANAVTAALSGDGKLSFYNLAGNVDLVIDVVGFYEPSSSGPAGPQGPAGVAGLAGVAGPVGPQGTNASDAAGVLWVAKNGTGAYATVKAALDAIGTTLPAATSTNRYLVKVGPGTFDEPTGIDLKSFVSIEGSGPGITIIRSPGTATDRTTVRGTGTLTSVEIRQLTIENTAVGGANGTAVSAVRLTSATGTVVIRGIAALVGNNPGFLAYAVQTVDSSVSVIDSTLSTGSAGDGYALRAEGTSDVRIDGSQLNGNASIGTFNSSRVVATSATLGGSPSSVVNFGSSLVRVIGSTLTGSVGGSTVCAASFRAVTLATLAPNCA